MLNKQVFFIDDLPNQISSVSNSCKNIITIHFLQNKKLIKIIPEVKDCNYKVDNWKDVKKIILNNILQSGFSIKLYSFKVPIISYSK